MADLRAIAKDLYAVPLADFVKARKQAADGADDTELAKQVLALRKPSAAAWAVNALAREQGELVEEVLELGEQLRDAQADADGSRTRLLDRARRDLTSQALDEATRLVKASGGTLSGPAASGVEQTLRAAMTDPDAGDAVQDGLLVTSFEANPFEPVDLTDIVAVPRDGSTPRPARRTKKGPTQLERKRLEVAEKAVDKARRKAESAAEDVGTRTDERQEIQDELSELRKRAKQIELEIRETEASIDKADKALDRAEAAERSAQEALDEAQAEVDRLS